VINPAITEVDSHDLLSLWNRIDMHVRPPQFKVSLLPVFVRLIWHEEISCLEDGVAVGALGDGACNLGVLMIFWGASIPSRNMVNIGN